MYVCMYVCLCVYEHTDYTCRECRLAVNWSQWQHSQNLYSESLATTTFPATTCYPPQAVTYWWRQRPPPGQPQVAGENVVVRTENDSVGFTDSTENPRNEWVLNKAAVERKLLDTVKARKLAHYGHTMRKQGSCLEKEIMQGTMPGACRRGRPHTAWMDDIKTWTGLPVEESVRMTEDSDKRWKYVHDVANPWC